MALSRSRRREGHIDYWPGFVDALATLLLVIIFLLSVFMLSQYFLAKEVNSKDSVLTKLNAEITELTQLLSLERSAKGDADDQLTSLKASLAKAEADKSRLSGLLAAGSGTAGTTDDRIQALTGQLDDEKRVTQRALAQVELLNQQIAALRRQIGALEAALNVSDTRDKESQTKIADLGRRLNLALAQRVQELQRYRSDFFGRLREILGNRSDISVVGDRFVFQSEVLFPVGQETINDNGRKDLDKLATAIKQLEAEIPPDVNWTIRVDGHTDAQPISAGGRFKSNWELSAARAISVVRYLVDKGVSPKHLVAAGFGEFQPLDDATTPEAYNKNRRIEIKLTDR
jgi:chemotaxis protein MotB